MMTELEGAILTEIGYRGQHTAFKVRQAFKRSQSSEWQGSAGSVYPAIERLVKKGMVVAAVTSDARGTRELSLTEEGRTALMKWALDLTPATAIGADPFRLRIGLWQTLSPNDKMAHARQLTESIARNIMALKSYGAGQDPFESAQIDLAIKQQELRLAWIKQWTENRAD